jgi:hypothetical protein
MDISEILKGLKLALTYQKEQEILASIERVHQSAMETLRVDADTRRLEVRAIIRAMNELEAAIISFEFHYKRLKPSFGSESVALIDAHIQGLKDKRQKLAQEKNRR